MRIMHVATLVTPDGAYGGPIRVAINQLRELQRRGHDVVLVAGARGFAGELPNVIDGVPVELFPVKTVVPRAGFAGLASWQLWHHVRATLRRTDVLHVHVARDLITMPAALLARRSNARLILQTHGMIDISPNPLSGMFDALMTRRVFARAQQVLALTPAEKSELEALGLNRAPVSIIVNGVPTSDVEQVRSEVAEVLFLARLHVRKRPTTFVEMARVLHVDHPEVRFNLVGPDEGEAPAVEKLIASSGTDPFVRWEGPLSPSDTSDRLKESDIYVLPSLNEVFPMSVLEAMSVGRPVVITRSNGLADILERAGAAVVVEESLESLTAGVRGLLEDGDRRATLGARGLAFARENWSMAAVGDTLESLYEPGKALC